MGEETFLAKVNKWYRVTIALPVRESIGLKVGDIVRITIRKDHARDS